MLAERQIGFDSLGQRRQAKLLQPVDVGPCEPLVSKVDERRAPPERERRGQRLRRERGVVPRERPSADLELLLEAVDVDLARPDSKCVPVTTRDQDTVAERPPEPRDVVLEDLGRARWRRAVPELVDQRLAGHGLVRAQEKKRQERALPTGARCDEGTVVIDLERTKYPVVHEDLGPTYPSPSG